MKVTYYPASGSAVEFETTSTAAYKLTNLYDGFCYAPVAHRTVRAPYQHGISRISSDLDPRDISFEILIQAATLQELFDAQRTLARSLNPINGAGVLEFEQEDGTTYSITCIGNGAPVLLSGSGNRYSGIQRATLQFVAHDPRWYDTNSTVDYFRVTASPLFPFGFPFSLPSDSVTSIISNDGDLDSEVTMIVWGPVTNPSFTNNTTGETFSAAMTIAANEQLVVTTGFGNKTVTLQQINVYSAVIGQAIIGSMIIGAIGVTVETNAFQYVDEDSVFWSLSPGSNSVTFSNSSAGAAAYASLEHRNYYAGV